jgi:hypothetical protein
MALIEEEKVYDFLKAVLKEVEAIRKNLEGLSRMYPEAYPELSNLSERAKKLVDSINVFLGKIEMGKG